MNRNVKRTEVRWDSRSTGLQEGLQQMFYDAGRGTSTGGMQGVMFKEQH